ncbi:esterase/lipase family protein [Nocardioides jejuensis]|uniref:Lipase n=1 Tax=Nocardioides jejuensis TaxID=2502782 RepID=A0A4R1CGZ8_9ACTN|nr:lipase [Nocardioides jejuensis]TCJ30439.1 lipase [Nocardioides jejuensis]
MLLRRVMSALTAVLVLAGLSTCMPSANAATNPAAPYAPLTRQGPALSVPGATIKAAMTCHGNPKAGPPPVYLNPATSVTGAENYQWNWEKVFTAQGRYWCTMTMPFHTFGDIQTAAEYIVYAIRTMYAQSGRKVTILGHSQGGMSGRWALRFWPDTRAKVAEVIGMAPSNHGTKSLPVCGLASLTTCTPAVWQQQAGSTFLKALNSGAETFAGIDYTNIYTKLDEVVTPYDAGALHTGGGRIANIEVHSVCAADPYEHVMMGTVSPAVYGIVMDALDHAGPAVATRVDKSLCSRLYMPGINPLDVVSFAPLLTGVPSLVTTPLPMMTLSGAPMVKAEPPLRCYAYAAGC